MTLPHPGPLAILGLSVAFIIFAIAVMRLHAFFALMIAAAMVGIATAAGQTGGHRFVRALESVTAEFGASAGKVAFTIALAAVIGFSLMQSGAAEKIIRRFIAVVGERRAAVALLGCSFMLSAPVFADTVFMLLLPLARALSLRTRRDYLLYALAISAGGVITNGTVPPAPGPLVVAGVLKLELGRVILAGFAFGILPAAAALLMASWFNARMPVLPRPGPGETAESAAALAVRLESELPEFWISFAPIFLPMALIAAASTVGILHLTLPPAFAGAVEFIGDKNVALLIGAVIAVGVNARRQGLGWRQAGGFLGKPVEAAAVLILIISAGGAYGGMIKNAGVGEVVRSMAGGGTINFVLIAWAITAVLRAAQGSATVAMITGAGITLSMAGSAGFGVHPMYILIACGYGSKVMTWMNDGGFWSISRFGALTQGELLRSWTPLACAISVCGLVEVLIASSFWPNLL